MKKSRKENVSTGIRPKEWTPEEVQSVKSFIKAQQAKRTPEQKLRTNMLSVRFQMEAYLQDENVSEKEMISMEAFLDTYLHVLNFSFKKFAQAIDTTDGNLKKYLSGERKFNIDLALRFSSFFHTSPDLWMNVYIKNELILLKKEKKQMSKYKKYDYEKVLAEA